MKYTLLVLLVFWLVLPAGAQEKNDDVIFKAMQDEMQRSQQLSLPGMPSPFFMGYTVAYTRQFRAAATLGGVIEYYDDPTGIAGVEMLLGDYQNSSNFSYGNEILQTPPLPANPDYDLLRRNFWLSSDMAYKYALQSGAMKFSTLKDNPPSPEEAQLADLEKVKPCRSVVNYEKTFTIDRAAIEKMVSEMSAVFVDYKDIFNSMVFVSGLQKDIYRLTSDGVMLKEPLSIVSVNAVASINTPDGVKIDDMFSLTVDRLESLPSIEELKRQMKDFAEDLIRLRDAPQIEDYYTGPVLFEDGACFAVFSGNLLNRGALIAFRSPVGRSGFKTLADQLGQKIIDNRLTVKNYSTLADYNGTPLMGAYEIDAEGVVPAPEITLVEKGVMRGMLNGCIPAVNATHSTGSSRFALSDNRVDFITAPGTIHIQVEKGLKPDKMKKALLKAAKAKNLDYAYIVRSITGNASCIYRVDVKDGKETQVRFADISAISLSKLKNIAEISAGEKVSNYLYGGQVVSSVIYPSSILLEDMEVNKRQMKTEKPPVIKSPLQR